MASHSHVHALDDYVKHKQRSNPNLRSALQDEIECSATRIAYEPGALVWAWKTDTWWPAKVRLLPAPVLLPTPSIPAEPPGYSGLALAMSIPHSVLLMPTMHVEQILQTVRGDAASRKPAEGTEALDKSTGQLLALGEQTTEDQFYIFFFNLPETQISR